MFSELGVTRRISWRLPLVLIVSDSSGLDSFHFLLWRGMGLRKFTLEQIGISPGEESRERT